MSPYLRVSIGTNCTDIPIKRFKDEKRIDTVVGSAPNSSKYVGKNGRLVPAPAPERKFTKYINVKGTTIFLENKILNSDEILRDSKIDLESFNKYNIIK